MKLFQVLKIIVPNSRGSAIEIQTMYLGDSSETAITRMETAKQEESGNGVSYLIQSVNAEVKEKAYYKGVNEEVKSNVEAIKGVTFGFSDMLSKPTEVKWRWSNAEKPRAGEQVRCKMAGGEFVVGIYKEEMIECLSTIRDDENREYKFETVWWCYESEYQEAFRNFQEALRNIQPNF